jgi:hypothetical protein
VILISAASFLQSPSFHSASNKIYRLEEFGCQTQKVDFTVHREASSEKGKPSSYPVPGLLDPISGFSMRRWSATDQKDKPASEWIQCRFGKSDVITNG